MEMDKITNANAEQMKAFVLVLWIYVCPEN